MIASARNHNKVRLNGILLPQFGNALDKHLIDFATPTAFFGVTRRPTFGIGFPFVGETISGTTSGTPQLKIQLSITLTEITALRIWWYSELVPSTANTVCAAELIADTAGPLTCGEIAFDPNSVFDSHEFSGFCPLTLPAGVHTFSLNFYKISGGSTANIRRARLVALRA